MLDRHNLNVPCTWIVLGLLLRFLTLSSRVLDRAKEVRQTETAKL